MFSALYSDSISGPLCVNIFLTFKLSQCNCWVSRTLRLITFWDENQEKQDDSCLYMALKMFQVPWIIHNDKDNLPNTSIEGTLVEDKREGIIRDKNDWFNLTNLNV